MGGSTKQQTQTQTTQAEIPAFLQPFMQTGANVGTGALTNLQTRLGNATAADLVAPYDVSMTPAQQKYSDMVGAALGPDGLIRNALTDTRNFQASAGNYINRMLPTFDKGITNAIEGEFIPGSATNTLDRYATNDFQLDPTANAALRSSAGGDGMYGSPAFNEAVQASIRAARPSILSGFAQGGSGAIKGGLAQTAMQQAASDSFARLYGDERSRQLASAGQLGQFQLAGRGQQIDTAATRGNLALNEQQTRNQGLNLLGTSLNNERQRQLQAITAAPGIGAMGLEAVGNVAGMEQANKDRAYQQSQAELTAPITAQQMLLAAMQGVPLSQLFGTNATTSQPITRNRSTGALGGALAGAKLGSVIPGLGTGIGAGIGGLLGAFG